MNERIEMTDTVTDAIIKLVEGNPGAVKVCTEMIKYGESIDPDSAWGGIGNLLSLDTHRIYGSRIWMLYKDVCGEDLTKTVGILRALQLGFLKEDVLQHAISNYGEGIDVDLLVSKVKKILPRFGVKT